MARIKNKLTDRTAKALKEPGRHSDGGGLYLSISGVGEAQRRRWTFMYTWRSKTREMGLGAFPDISLAGARQARDKWAEVLRSGRDPIVVRDAERAAVAAVPTFGQVADDLIADKQHEWRNTKHRAQWVMTLKEYAAPLRAKPVDEISTEDVLDVLKPIWLVKSETASRLRGRIEHVLDAARAKGHRSGMNPALWRGHLDKLLPRRQKLSRGHHAAIPYEKVSAFVTDLRGRDAMGARALEFAILTAARTGEVIGAKWAEIDMARGVWIIPAERMKAGREHRVPLTRRALEIVAELKAARVGNFIFPSNDPEKPLSNMAMEMVLRRMKADFTVHGFRSAFRDWAGNETDFPREVAEAALAHVIGDKAEQAYRRGDALEKRRALMDAWGTYLDFPTINAGSEAQHACS